MIYEDKFIRVEREENELPWVKIFTAKPYRELSDCDEASRARLFEAMLVAEKAMLEFYKPTKINIASLLQDLKTMHFFQIAFGLAQREKASLCCLNLTNLLNF